MLWFLGYSVYLLLIVAAAVFTFRSAVIRNPHNKLSRGFQVFGSLILSWHSYTILREWLLLLKYHRF